MLEKLQDNFGINLKQVTCPACGENLPGLRVPRNLHQLMWGGWSCPHCHCRMDKWGQPVDGQPRPGDEIDARADKA